MPKELILPAVLMTSAFVFYTTGVWAERAARDIRPWHLVLFWLGLVCDTLGTELMLDIQRQIGRITDWTHTITGALALSLMLGHAVWATFVWWRGHERARREFHRYSLVVWAIWLIPYFWGMVVGITRGTNAL